MGLHYTTSTFPAIIGDADAIRAAAHKFNSVESPEAIPLIESGTPIVLIIGDTLGSTGRRIRVSVAPVVVITEGPDKGGHIYAAEPEVLVVNSFDGRLSPNAIGAKLLNKHLKNVQVEIRNVRR